MARIADYTQREETMAQVHLAKWATDLQRSLQNERERYTAIARDDRAFWLTERLSECVDDGSLVPITQTPGYHRCHGLPEKESPAATASGGLGRTELERKIHRRGFARGIT